MADDKTDDKKAQAEAAKKEEEEANKEVAIVCTLNLRQILVALHEKALKEIKSKDLTVQNSAIEGEGGKDAKFYGAGEHLIAAIPRDQKGLDKNIVDKKSAVEVLANYVQWFVGPDLKAKVTEDVLKPLEDGAEGKVKDNHQKKDDIKKSKKDDLSGKKFRESIYVPSFSQYLLLEADPTKAGEDPEGDDQEDVDAKNDATDAAAEDADAGKVEQKDDKEKPEFSDGKAQGWYVNYRLTIPGQKEHPIADAMKKFVGDLVKAFGVQFGSIFSGDTSKHTIGGLVDDLDSIFGKMDATEFESEFNNEMKKRMKSTDAQAKVWDTKTILKFLKQDVGKHKAKLAPVQYALCVRVDKRDKSYKLFNEDAIANIANTAIKGALRGIAKKIKFGVKAKDVILVNNYADNKKDKEDNKYTDKSDGAVADSQKPLISKPLIVETKKYVKKEHKLDLADIAKENIETNEYESFDSLLESLLNGNSLLMSMFDELDESLLLEGHSEEQLEVEKQIDRIGVKNIINNVDQLRKNYLEHLTKVKAANKDNKYVQKILVNSKNWISKEFIGKLRDQNDATEDDIKKMLKDCSGRVGKTDDIRFELQALVDALNIEDSSRQRREER